MNSKIKILAIISLFVNTCLFTQQSRLDQLGGLSYSIIDIDSQIDPFILGGNPAWLVNSQQNQRLDITPVFKNSNGDYHRYYESGDVFNYSVNFIGIKPLGKNGTFRGLATYQYDLHKDRNKILTLNPYSGDAFFFTDTTSGDYKYSGPTFEFMHSLEIFDNLYLGASVNYKILDGLKKVYTYAETLYRNVSGNLGLAYKISDNLVLGANYKIIDEQERIVATDVNNRTVQTFLYRGEIYNIELRGTSQSYKLKKFGNSVAFQTQYKPFDNFTIGLNANYLLHNSKSLFPFSSIIEVEDGYTSQENTEIVIVAKWLQSNNLTFGFVGGYNDNNSWTKNSKHNLTIWDINISNVYGGIGATYTNVENDFLIGTEYELHSIAADSNKYIDDKYSQINGISHFAKLGIEKSINDIFKIRVGYNFIFQEHDFIFGGDNVTTHFITLGGNAKISEALEIESRIEYSSTNLSANELHKNNFGIYTTFRFYKF
ncbi:MAG: hypothetical protein COW71_10435 [Ignavibacteriales bacterium CG18_big_fil_WC_8_21_14_2_50_31_20]|nr:MAG: hypothetical protein COW71_10435 [Ignavibacteriales bacterium CG18_big_fil_WC_8_21_14_2_50_31_20]